MLVVEMKTDEILGDAKMLPIKTCPADKKTVDVLGPIRVVMKAVFAEILIAEILFTFRFPDEMLIVEIPDVVTFPKVMFAI